MPYIRKEHRDYVSHTREMETSGDLNFLITDLCKRYLETKGLSYITLNEIVGALTCAGAEFYRRVVVPYEDKKIEENGDVY